MPLVGRSKPTNSLICRITPLRLLAAACVACTTTLARAEQFPYTAYVTAPDVYVRSGPGENYYPVAKLDHGEKVEVYRHDPGGWYAIRPPAGSFSWVSAEFIEPRQGNLGVVLGEHVVARVGSSFSDTRDVIQVRLDRGEEVEILEAHEFNSGPAAQTWYKISPPAGEFRWVSGRYLDRQLADAAPHEPSADNNLLLARQNPRRAPETHDRTRQRRSRQDEEETADGDWVDDADDEPDDEDGGVRHAVHEEPPPRTKRSTKRNRPEREEEEEEEQESADDRDRPIRLKPEERRPKVNLKEEAEDLDLALSAIVLEDPARWDFRLLKRDAENALARADTALDRGRIRRVLRKIENFADIQQRHVAVMNPPISTAAPTRPFAGEPPISGLSALRYDGVGRLTQLTTLDPRLPQFALMDARGQVAAYVSPAPGVNLRRYLNQEVGINGTLGYLPERQAQLLTAKRIVPIESGALR